MIGAKRQPVPRGDTNSPVAICDLGTFSGLILIARKRGGRIEAIREEAHTVDLFRESGSNRNVGSAALRRAGGVLARLDALAAELGCMRGTVICTEAIRSAGNRDRAVAALAGHVRFPIRVVSQRQEALLSASGSLIGLPGSRRPSAVIDVGGGSTEILFPKVGQGWSFRGVRYGAARATREWFADGKPAEGLAQEQAARTFRALRLPDSLPGHRMVGVGGTITTLAAMELRLRSYSAGRIHGVRLSVGRIEQFAHFLLGKSEQQIARMIPFDPARARILTAGTFLWAGVLNRVGAREVMVSAHGLRWGAAARLLETNPS